uniref:Uncharacterized protein n=1 Tax=Timema monikensis TaxID=170555 RepID=A0A7R9HTP8_9NEOP|nr:unnamed protein product [Timema monikensis]
MHVFKGARRNCLQEEPTGGSGRSSKFMTVSTQDESDQDHGSSDYEDGRLTPRCISIASTDVLHPHRSLRSHYTHCPSSSHHHPPPLYRRPPESLSLDLVMPRLEGATNRVTSFKRESKTAQTLSVVVGGFVACWLPFFVVYLIKPFLPQDSINSMFQTFLTWLGQSILHIHYNKSIMGLGTIDKIC